MKYLLHIRFLGTAYHGYQIQKNCPTVQAELNRATEELFGFPCDIVGCSRTDSGVHANEFCCTVSQKGKDGISFTIPVERLPAAMNVHLPKDISVFFAESVAETFHARYDVYGKEYLYRIYDAPVRNPFEDGRSLHYPSRLSESAIAAMNCAAGFYVGTHDFRSYMAQGSKIKDTVRTVFEAEVFRDGDCVVFRVFANGFLYNMVRIMVGTLLAVAEQKYLPEEIVRITESRDRCAAGMTVAPVGLYLNRVQYRNPVLEGDCILLQKGE